jgi:hypothetical protein
MYPLRDDLLTLGEIAQHWARSMPERPPKSEVCQYLLKEFWRGEFEDFFPSSLLRRHLFALILQTKVPECLTNSGRVSLVGPPPRSTVDVNHPFTPASGAELEAVYRNLAGQPFEAYAVSFGYVFRSIPLHKEAFAEYCRKWEMPLPSFWFSRSRAPVSTAKARTQSIAWLSDLARQPKEKSKRVLNAEALKRFPGLSTESFNRAWDEVVPRAWRQPGAMKRKKQRE